MTIGLVDIDGHAKKKKWGATVYPNLALCKIARWHKQQGDDVEWAFPFKHYDRIYISKVFNFSSDDRTAYDADEIVKGGTGYDITSQLPDEIDRLQPDYSIYPNIPKDTAYDEWQSLLKAMMATAADKLKEGCFLLVNIADILAFKDETMPRYQANNPDQHSITSEMVKAARNKYPDFSKQQLADLLGCSNQTIDRRINGNNARGGKVDCATRVKLVGGSIEAYAYDVGLYLYDKRIWHKDPAWATSRWTISTLKAVSETEDIYVFWKPGEYTVNRNRLSHQEWRDWGMRQLWDIPSVRANDIHPAMFPETLARRIVRLYTDEGATICDPFMGSGTTAIACIKEKRHFIGFEISKKYYDKACKRIRNEQRQLSLF